MRDRRFANAAAPFGCYILGFMPTSSVRSAKKSSVAESSVKSAAWTFLTNHAHVLLCLADERDALMKDVAARIGITERAVQRIVSDLEASGYVERERDGRRNRYRVRPELPLRHPIEGHHNVETLLSLVGNSMRPRVRVTPAAATKKKKVIRTLRRK